MSYYNDWVDPNAFFKRGGNNDNLLYQYRRVFQKPKIHLLIVVGTCKKVLCNCEQTNNITLPDKRKTWSIEKVTCKTCQQLYSEIETNYDASST